MEITTVEEWNDALEEAGCCGEMPGFPAPFYFVQGKEVFGYDYESAVSYLDDPGTYWSEGVEAEVPAMGGFWIAGSFTEERESYTEEDGTIVYYTAYGVGIGRYRWKVPNVGSAGDPKYPEIFEIKWQEVSSAGGGSNKSWTWGGDPEELYSPWYVGTVQELDHSQRVVNVECLYYRSSRYGQLPEKFAIPT